jgi:hypothetical protein
MIASVQAMSAKTAFYKTPISGLGIVVLTCATFNEFSSAWKNIHLISVG